MVDFQCVRFGRDMCFGGNCTVAPAFQTCDCDARHDVILDDAFFHNFGERVKENLAFTPTDLVSLQAVTMPNLFYPIFAGAYAALCLPQLVVTVVRDLPKTRANARRLIILYLMSLASELLAVVCLAIQSGQRAGSIVFDFFKLVTQLALVHELTLVILKPLLAMKGIELTKKLRTLRVTLAGCTFVCTVLLVLQLTYVEEAGATMFNTIQLTVILSYFLFSVVLGFVLHVFASRLILEIRAVTSNLLANGAMPTSPAAPLAQVSGGVANNAITNKGEIPKTVKSATSPSLSSSSSNNSATRRFSAHNNPTFVVTQSALSTTESEEEEDDDNQADRTGRSLRHTQLLAFVSRLGILKRVLWGMTLFLSLPILLVSVVVLTLHTFPYLWAASIPAMSYVMILFPVAKRFVLFSAKQLQSQRSSRRRSSSRGRGVVGQGGELGVMSPSGSPVVVSG